MVLTEEDGPGTSLPSPIKEEDVPEKKTTTMELIWHGLELKRMGIFMKLGLPGMSSSHSSADIASV